MRTIRAISMKSISYEFFVAPTLILLCACASVRIGGSMETRILKLVDQTTKSKKVAQDAYTELESIGNQAVPFPVSHLDDMRPLASEEIILRNKASDAFESERHYGPKTVHDALAAILSQITGKSFVIVYNGATSVEREENRSMWVKWCQSKFPHQAEICNGRRQRAR